MDLLESFSKKHAETSSQISKVSKTKHFDLIWIFCIKKSATFVQS